MKTNILWLLPLAAALLFLLWKTRSVPADSVTPEKPEKPEKETLTEEQQLLGLLRQQREETALLQYRQDCAKLFHGLSRGIQIMLALAVTEDLEGEDLCEMLEDCARNENLALRMNRRKPQPTPEPLSPEEEAADAETLRKLICREQTRRVPSVTAIAWEELAHRLLPCLEKLLPLAADFQAEACRKQLAELETILSGYDIYPIWYRDERVQQSEDMQWDYVQTDADPIPALYHCHESSYTRVGGPGYTGPQEEEREP